MGLCVSKAKPPNPVSNPNQVSNPNPVSNPRIKQIQIDIKTEKQPPDDDIHAKRKPGDADQTPTPIITPPSPELPLQRSNSSPRTRRKPLTINTAIC
jgi:hypothetical protein